MAINGNTNRDRIGSRPRGFNRQAPGISAFKRSDTYKFTRACDTYIDFIDGSEWVGFGTNPESLKSRA